MDQARKSGRYNRIFWIYDNVRSQQRIMDYLLTLGRQENMEVLYIYYEEMDVESIEWMGNGV